MSGMSWTLFVQIVILGSLTWVALLTTLAVIRGWREREPRK